MKKLLKGLVAFVCAVCCMMGVVACDEVKDGSKIQKVTVTISVDGVEQDFNFELYLNFAPGTIEHFTYLAQSGYYNDTAISNVNGHVEFGGYYFKDGKLASKYDDSEKSYLKLITAEYIKNKTIGPKDSERYAGEDRFVNGEFEKAGFAGNKLSLDGALVLKRDVNDDAAALAYNTGRATMAVTFGSDYYFNSSSEFAILGKILSDDATDSDETSYARLKAFLTGYSKDADENTYYYYTKGGDFGNYFMKNKDGEYFAQDENGDYYELIEDADVEEDAVELLLQEFTDNADYMNVLPYGDKVIKVVKITFAE
ncbi:MAG: peptidylprolyl isomerase [Clostridia bacterium]|nr:peptidylprolyl isomerase [Clostridia bacterium]